MLPCSIFDPEIFVPNFAFETSPSSMLSAKIAPVPIDHVAPLLDTVISPLGPSVTPAPPEAETTPLLSIDKLVPILIPPRTEPLALGKV